MGTAPQLNLFLEYRFQRGRLYPVLNVCSPLFIEVLPLPFPLRFRFIPPLTRGHFDELLNLFPRSLPPVVQFRRNRLRFQPGGAALLLRRRERLFFRPQPEPGFHMLLLINSPAGSEQFLPLLLRFAPEHPELLLFLLIHIGFPVDQ